MELIQIFGYYFFWHYTKALRDAIRISGNYIWFVANFFSIGLLAQTLFSPWRRLRESGGRGRSESFVGALFVNTLMRLVGFCARSFTILCGFVALGFTVFLIFSAFIVWIFLPVIIFIIFFAGLGYVTKAIV